ncbi:hypothetical protein [Polaribacter glomeratus]|uniref:DUF3667 domain-containing protein n=1 Tax=Polaribacter glomeratus TaxID=102 RepID=A0A2S7WZE8_9FLAO|nr:hypothetical protein [Polaribacter glomeratus]PQJ82742.1 hypothetical protein BTO16_09205 [Polaribacter glomeratus]
MIGLYNTKVKYESLAQESKTEIVDLIKEETSKTKEALTDKKIDSIKKKLNEKMKSSFIPVPEKVRKNILAEVEKEARDTTENKMNSSIINFNVGEGDSKLDKFVNYQKKYPNSSIDVALDSLEFEKNFTNRFIYTRAKAANSFTNDEESRDQFLNQILSFGSISLFVLLPIFTLFLKLFYIRRKYTYVDHLIFVFHIQTVFFMLFSIFYLLKIVGISPQLWVFVTLFLLYLIIAMKQFYQQGYFKTFVKFLLLNLSYTIVASIGVVFVLLISFALF